ncbi:S1 family peptidase [Streptomyces sp. URMC 129]|uniref:S1 family peptidase n=1 Tax=Streptomyces sp. URMC 129 TaxID=3423407 RepID=UPI003F1E2868
MALGLAVVLALTGHGPAGADTPHTFTEEELAAASDAVLAADVGGTAWAVDEAVGSVLLQADSTVTEADLDRIRQEAGAYADAISVERVPGELTPLLAGGEGIRASGGWSCSVGFNVLQGTTKYFVTAGHCTEGYPRWSVEVTGSPVGPTADSSFPGNDWGVVYYDYQGYQGPGGVYLWNGTFRPITGAAEAYIGMPVERSGRTTGLRGGTVTGLNWTVDYGGGDVVSGLIQTNACAEPGDSGGPLFSGTTAVGLTSGGSGNCSSGGTTYYQPITEVLNHYGFTLP